ncbi:MAG: hypothetical protein ABIP94_16555 [Planctomycetota bacterium]
MNARLLLLPGIALVVAAVIWKTNAAPAGTTVTPAATWRVGSGSDMRQGSNYDNLAAETSIQLSIHNDEPRFVYVFSHSIEDGTLLLWPSPPLESDLPQPLPPGTHVLPGRLADKELTWTTRSGIHSVTTFVVVAARDKVDELEGLLPRLRRWTNRVFPDRSMLVTVPLGETQIIGEGRTLKFPSPLLQRAADLAITESMPNGPMSPDGSLPGVWLTSWKVVEKKGSAPDASKEPLKGK